MKVNFGNLSESKQTCLNWTVGPSDSKVISQCYVFMMNSLHEIVDLQGIFCTTWKKNTDTEVFLAHDSASPSGTPPDASFQHRPHNLKAAAKCCNVGCLKTPKWLVCSIHPKMTRTMNSANSKTSVHLQSIVPRAISIPQIILVGVNDIP